MEKLKKRWGMNSNWQVIVIFIVFAITGSTSAKFSGPLVDVFGLTKELLGSWGHYTIQLLIVLPIYQVLLVFFGWLFGEFSFFWDFEKKMLRYMGLGFILK